MRLLRDIWRVILTDLKIKPYNGLIFLDGSYWVERYGGGFGYICRCKHCGRVYGKLSYDMGQKKFLSCDICPFCGERDYEWVTEYRSENNEKVQE